LHCIEVEKNYRHVNWCGCLINHANIDYHSRRLWHQNILEKKKTDNLGGKPELEDGYTEFEYLGCRCIAVFFPDRFPPGIFLGLSLSTILITKFGGTTSCLEQITEMHLYTKPMASWTVTLLWQYRRSLLLTY
jgi:hypothetical protein